MGLSLWKFSLASAGHTHSPVLSQPFSSLMGENGPPIKRMGNHDKYLTEHEMVTGFSKLQTGKKSNSQVYAEWAEVFYRLFLEGTSGPSPWEWEDRWPLTACFTPSTSEALFILDYLKKKKKLSLKVFTRHDSTQLQSRHSEADFHAFKASLIYKESSRSTRATQWQPVSKKPRPKNGYQS